jgi:hypothetical protein
MLVKFITRPAFTDQPAEVRAMAYEDATPEGWVEIDIGAGVGYVDWYEHQKALGITPEEKRDA